MILVDVDRVVAAQVCADQTPPLGGRRSRLGWQRVAELQEDGKEDGTRRSKNRHGGSLSHTNANTCSPLNFLARESHGKKITTRNSTLPPVASCESQRPFCVPVTLASSQTPCGPMTMRCRSKWMPGNAPSSSM